MAIICRQYGFLFIMTPRTACTAIGELLCEHYGGEFLPSEDILDGTGQIKVPKKHTTLAELLEHGLLTENDTKALLKVATVRNPLTLLSHSILSSDTNTSPCFPILPRGSIAPQPTPEI